MSLTETPHGSNDSHEIYRWRPETSVRARHIESAPRGPFELIKRTEGYREPCRLPD
jgi:hypothetical protein